MIVNGHVIKFHTLYTVFLRFPQNFQKHFQKHTNGILETHAPCASKMPHEGLTNLDQRVLGGTGTLASKRLCGSTTIRDVVGSQKRHLWTFAGCCATCTKWLLEIASVLNDAQHRVPPVLTHSHFYSWPGFAAGSRNFQMPLLLNLS